MATSFQLASANSSIVEGEELNRTVQTRARLYRRFERDVRSKNPLPQQYDEKGQSEPRRYFEPVDGDFTSQYIYVLDSTENPEKGKSLL